jgi:tagaturonate reductase
MVLAMAAQFCFYRGHARGKDIGLNDSPDTIAFFRETWNNYDGTTDGSVKLVAQILSNPNLWAVDLAGVPGLQGQLARQVYRIESEGMARVVNDEWDILK